MQYGTKSGTNVTDKHIAMNTERKKIIQYGKVSKYLLYFLPWHGSSIIVQHKTAQLIFFDTSVHKSRIEYG